MIRRPETGRSDPEDSLRLRRINRRSEAYERDFWAASDIDGFHAKRGAEALPTAAVLTAGLDEWRRSTRGGIERVFGDGAVGEVAQFVDRQDLGLGHRVRAEVDALAARFAAGPTRGLARIKTMIRLVATLYRDLDVRVEMLEVRVADEPYPQ